jgi:DNA-binding XRE family transcriptional regulator
MPEREVITCGHCKLVQFRTAKDVCRRCRKSTAPPPAPFVEPDPEPPIHPNRATLAKACAAVLRLHRIGHGWSQSRAAKRHGCVRTYISKVENGTYMPTLTSLQRFAQAYRVRLSSLILEIEAAQQLLEG